MKNGFYFLCATLVLLALQTDRTNADPISGNSALVGELCFYSLYLDRPGLSKMCPGDTIELERQESQVNLTRRTKSKYRTPRIYSVITQSERFEYLLKLEEFLEICSYDTDCRSHESIPELQFLAESSLSYLQMKEIYEILGQKFERSLEKTPTLFRKDVIYKGDTAYLINRFNTLSDGNYVFFSAAKLTNSN